MKRKQTMLSASWTHPTLLSKTLSRISTAFGCIAMPKRTLIAGAAKDRSPPFVSEVGRMLGEE